MWPAELPRPDAAPLAASVAACLAAILRIERADVPCPVARHPQPWTVWRNWLAQRGLGLVPVLDPADFHWPGPWLALLRGMPTGESVAAVAFGIPPDLVWHPFGGPETFGDVHAGFAMAPLDVALWRALPVGRGGREAGRVEAIVVAREAAAPPVLVDEALARAGRGLAGDRYAAGRGTFTNPNASGIDLTLIEAEVLDELAPLLSYEEARRNVITRGIDLNALVGRRFAIGEVVCVGQRLCEPCAHLQRLTRPGTLRALVHRGGLRADILTGGTIRVADALSPDPPS